METIQTLTRRMAAALAALEAEYIEAGGTVTGWDIRGEVAPDIEAAPDLIAVLTYDTAAEEIYGNRTLRLTGRLTGSLRMGARTDEEAEQELLLLAQVVYDYLGGLRYTEVGDAVVLQATCDSITWSRGAHACMAWVLPVDVVVQL